MRQKNEKKIKSDQVTEEVKLVQVIDQKELELIIFLKEELLTTELI